MWLTNLGCERYATAEAAPSKKKTKNVKDSAAFFFFLNKADKFFQRFIFGVDGKPNDHMHEKDRDRTGSQMRIKDKNL